MTFNRVGFSLQELLLVLAIVVQVSVLGATAYVVVHFIVKFW